MVVRCLFSVYHLVFADTVPSNKDTIGRYRKNYHINYVDLVFCYEFDLVCCLQWMIVGTEWGNPKRRQAVRLDKNKTPVDAGWHRPTTYRIVIDKELLDGQDLIEDEKWNFKTTKQIKICISHDRLN